MSRMHMALSITYMIAQTLSCANASLNHSDVPCYDTHFQCPTDSRCLPNEYMCDNVSDCKDGFDEVNCASK